MDDPTSLDLLLHADEAARSLPAAELVAHCGMAALEIEVVDERDQPLSYIGVEIRSAAGARARARTSPLGLVRFAALDPGTYHLDLHETDRDAWAPAAEPVPLAPEASYGGEPPQWSTRDEASGETTITVHPGDCLASLGLRHGRLVDEIWSAPANAVLRDERRSGYVLAPGDRVRIPARRPRAIGVRTGHRYRCVRKGVPELFRARFLDHLGAPRSELDAVITIECARSYELHDDIETATDAAGGIEVAIPPDARQVLVLLDPLGMPEVHAFALGTLDPAQTIAGAQDRLANLGYGPGVRGELDTRTLDALRRFQIDHDLSCTGEVDEATALALESVHGS